MRAADFLAIRPPLMSSNDAGCVGTHYGDNIEPNEDPLVSKLKTMHSRIIQYITQIDPCLPLQCYIRGLAYASCTVLDQHLNLKLWIEIKTLVSEFYCQPY